MVENQRGAGSPMSNLPAAIKLLPVGDTAWTLEFGEVIDPGLHSRVLGLADALGKVRASGGYAGIIDVVPTFRSLTVHYDPMTTDGERLGEALRELAAKAGTANAQGRRWQLPVCFDDEYAPDLNDLAAAKGMSCEAVIDRLLGTTFQVYMIGFMPGFP